MADNGSRRMTKQEFERLADFRYALRQFLRYSEETAYSVGLTPQKYQALLAIRGYPDKDKVSIGELAERLQIRHHSAVGIVDRLEDQGLVSREQDEQDRRIVCVRLTPLGEEMVERIASANTDRLKGLQPELSRLLTRMIEVE